MSTSAPKSAQLPAVPEAAPQGLPGRGAPRRAPGLLARVYEHFDTETGAAPDGAFRPSLDRRIAGLDELRGLAILAVLLCHAGVSFGAPFPRFFGALGVDVFFVVSGFLIGTILRKMRSRPHWLRTFYVRRIFRLWPLSFAVVAVGLAASIAAHRHWSNVMVYYLTFTQNFIRSSPAGVDPSSASYVGPLLGCSPLWSLAVEEQFYVILPLLMTFIRSRFMPAAVLCLALGSIVLRALFFVPPDGYIYGNPPETWFRLHYLAVGVLMSMPNTSGYLCALFLAWTASIAAAASTPVAAFEVACALAIALLTWRAVRGRPVLRNGFLAFSGRLCFGLYVLHYPLLKVLEAVFRRIDGPASLLALVGISLFFAASYGAAMLCFVFFERPILLMRTRFELPAR